MRILIALFVAVGLMAALGIVLLILGLQLSRAVVGGMSGPFARTGMLSKVTFGLLWLLIAGVASSFLGS